MHRDVKPANLLVRPDGVLKVTDFGLAQPLDNPACGQQGLLGMACYLAPRAGVGQPVTLATDLHALG